MGRDDREQPVREVFRPTGQATGWGCVGLAVALAVLYVVERDRGVPEWLLAGAVALGAFSWAVLLRPRVALVGSDLELRGPFDTVWVPLADVEKVAIGRVLAVSAGEHRWTSAALGRSHRQARRDDVAATSGSRVRGHSSLSYAALVEQRLRDAVRDARHRSPRSPGPSGSSSMPSPDRAEAAQGSPSVVRRLAWAEIVVLGLAVAVTLVLLLL